MSTFAFDVQGPDVAALEEQARVVLESVALGRWVDFEMDIEPLVLSSTEAVPVLWTAKVKGRLY